MGNFQKNIRISKKIQEQWELPNNFLQHTHYNANKDIALDSVIVKSITQVLLIYEKYTSCLNMLQLIDDGNHFDNEQDDGIYGNYICGDYDEFKIDEAIIDVRWDTMGVIYQILQIPVNHLPELPHIIIPLHQSVVSSNTPEIFGEIDQKADGCGAILLGSTPILGEDLENIIWEKEYRSTDEELFIERIPVQLHNNKQYTLIIWSYTNSKQINNNWNKGAYSVEWCEFFVDTLQKNEKLTLLQNFPDPFNSRTIIKYSLPDAGNISIKIFNIIGQEITTLIDQEQLAGEHYILWNGKNYSENDVASGVYFYNMTLDNQSISRKMMLTR